MLNKYVIGIDVGGTHTRIGQISASGDSPKKSDVEDRRLWECYYFS